MQYFFYEKIALQRKERHRLLFVTELLELIKMLCHNRRLRQPNCETTLADPPWSRVITNSNISTITLFNLGRCTMS